VVEALAHVPWDAVVVLVNSDKFGGMAVHHASVTRGVGDIGPTAVHELGHSFGLLGDEYVVDACVRTPAFPLPENVTDQPQDPPWAPFVDPGAPLPTEPGDGVEVGAFAGAWNCDDLYRPSEVCRMNEGHGPFCAACAELVTRRLLRFDDPAGEVWLEDRRVRARALLPDTEAVLVVDGVELGRGAVDALPRLPAGASEVDVTLEWRPEAVRTDPTHDLRETWSFREPEP
jgi:IgA Peptidase M64